MSNAIAFGKPASTRDARRADGAGRRARRRARAPGAPPPPRASRRRPTSASRAARAARLRRRRRERAQVARRHRPEVRVGGGRRRALVLAELRRDLVRRDDVRVGSGAAALRGDARSCSGTIRVQQADGDRLGVELGQRARSSGSSTPSGPSARARRRTARAGRAARDARAEPVEVRAGLPAEVEQVLEARGRDERRPRALALEQRVRRDRRPVREALDVARRRPRARRDDRLLLPRARSAPSPCAARRRRAGRRR